MGSLRGLAWGPSEKVFLRKSERFMSLRRSSVRAWKEWKRSWYLVHSVNTKLVTTHTSKFSATTVADNQSPHFLFCVIDEDLDQTDLRFRLSEPENVRK